MSVRRRAFAPSDADDARHMPQNRWGSVSIRIGIKIVPVLALTTCLNFKALRLKFSVNQGGTFHFRAKLL